MEVEVLLLLLAVLSAGMIALMLALAAPFLVRNLRCFGHPTGATGARMIVENVLQLRGEAGARQVSGARLALSHNIGGYPTGCAVSILGVE